MVTGASVTGAAVVTGASVVAADVVAVSVGAGAPFIATAPVESAAAELTELGRVAGADDSSLLHEVTRRTTAAASTAER